MWQSIFSRVYSTCCCRCLFGPEIIKIGQSSHKMYSNNILNFHESTSILNTCTKKSRNLLNAPRIYLSIYLSIYLFCYTLIHLSLSYLFIQLSFYLSISVYYLSIYLSLRIYLSVCLSESVHIYLSIYWIFKCLRQF